MRILIKISNGGIQRSLRMLAAHHARRTLHGLRELLPRVSLSLSDAAEPNGGLTKRCVVEMKAGDTGTVVMSSLAKNWQTAIKLALRGASKKLWSLWRYETASRSVRQLPMMRRPLLR